MEFAILKLLKKGIISVDCRVDEVIERVIVLKLQNTLLRSNFNILGSIKHQQES
jgi:hypothetical protein